MKMTELQGFSKKLLSEEKTSEHQRSILLVDIMNAIGFSKKERKIHRHCVHLLNVLTNIIRASDKSTVTIVGSTSDGMRGGIYGNQSDHDYDLLFRARNIKLETPRANYINSPLLLLHDNKDYDASFFVEEDDNFPGYVKLSLAEVNTNCVYLFNCIRMNDDKLYFSNSMIMDVLHKQIASSSKKFGQNLAPCQNGPAHSNDFKQYCGNSRKSDSVFCIHCDMWPNSANSFITRCKPNNWPSNSMLENIKKQGCDVVPVGHHDSTNNDMQWRISFPGERNLLLDLTDVHILCYALIKIILRENLNTFQREVVSSFHIKHVMFWCMERCSCQCVDSNCINCLNICLTKLIQMIKARHIPHYIIESRNLFSSKLTEKMSKEIVDILSKYDTTHVKLGAFERVFKSTRYNNVLLKHDTLKSTTMACFNSCFISFSSFVKRLSLFWDSYVPHNATESMLNYENILQHLEDENGAAIHYAKYVIRSIVGFLYYAKYKESNETHFLRKSKPLIQESLDLDNSGVKLRAAIFFLTSLEYSQSIEICDTFLTFPPRYKINSSYSEYNDDIEMKVSQQLFDGKTTEEIENIMKVIIQMFYSSVKLKSLPGNYDITQQDTDWIFSNLTNIYFHGLYMDVTFMTAEKWVVPDPILYELLSLPQNTDDEVVPFSGIYLDPMFVCLQTKFLCYHSMGNVNGMAAMLTLINSFITEYTFTTNSSCVYLNMFTYCLIKAGQHRQSVKYILQSLRIFPSRYNAASGYLKIVLQILNYLAI